MPYIIAFLEGIITFVSPCLLPMLPLYISYFAGGKEQHTRTILKNALGFILGFTTVFVLLGTLAGTFGRLVKEHTVTLNLITGGIVIVFGLYYLGVFRLPLFKGIPFTKTDHLGFVSSVLFGMVFSIGWTPCVGAFLGSALMMAANGAHVLQGTIMLLLYSLGLGIPFFLSALLIDKLKGAFTFIKTHYRVINIVSGLLLILIGILMATGAFGRLMTLLS